MKKTLLSVLVLSVSISIFAQPNFTSADMPNIGDQDTVMYLNYYPIENNLETETGNGYSWDFTSLPFSMYPGFITLDSFRVKTNIISIPYTKATIEEFVYDGTAGDINLFSYRNDTLFTHRSGAVVSGLILDPPMATIGFPVQFNKESSINYLFYNGATAIAERKTTFSYNGFGTLKLPGNKTYENVFRIKKVERDSSFLFHSSISYTSYIWYKQGGQVPLLRLSYSGAANLYFVFASKSNSTSTRTENFNLKSDFTIFPNPSNGKFGLSNLSFTPDKIEIYNSVGKKIFESKNSGEIDLTGSSRGIYYINIIQGSKHISKKLLLE